MTATLLPPGHTTIESLEQRIAALESSAPESESLTPNVLSINPDGTIQAVITGLIKALGLVLPAVLATGSPAGTNKISWNSQNDGFTVADIYATEQGGDQLILESQRGIINGGVRVSLIAQESRGGGETLPYIQFGASDDDVTFQSTIVWDSGGNSGFLQLAALANVVLAFGFQTVTWGGGSIAAGTTVTPAWPHTISAMYPFVTGIGINGSVNNAIGFISAQNGTTSFNPALYGPSGSINTQQSNLTWLALGIK